MRFRDALSAMFLVKLVRESVLYILQLYIRVAYTQGCAPTLRTYRVVSLQIANEPFPLQQYGTISFN